MKAIIDSHGGSCGVINHEHGVEFWFTIKQCKAANTEAKKDLSDENEYEQ